MIDYDSINEWLKSSEADEHFKKVAEEFLIKETIKEQQLERFHSKVTSDEFFENLVETIRAKYESDEYDDRYYRRGIEPPEDLYWFLFYYANAYGRECTNEEWEEHSNGFTSELYFIRGYYFNRMNGQGSKIIITKKSVGK